MCHDSETIGGHPGTRDTLARVSDVFWWLGLEHDVRGWCATCHVCRMTKPVPAFTAELRSELYDGPFRTLFIDTMGPISPSDGDFRYIANAECPLSRFA